MLDNKATVGKTTVGAGIAVLVVWLVGKVGIFAEPLSSEEGALVAGALTTVFNWLIPADWKPFGKK